MKQRKHLLLCVVFFCVCSAGYAQKADTAKTGDPRAVHMALLVRSDNDSIVLRWAPTRAGGWVVANKIGYVVERVAVANDGSFDPKAYAPVTSAPIKAWTLDEWKQRSDRNDTYAAIAAQSLYGKSFTPKSMSNGDMSAIRNAADELSNRYGFALFAADIDPGAAEGLGLRYVDHTVKAGERYVYRVYLAGVDTSLKFDTAYAFIHVTAYDSVAPPPGLTAEALDKRIILRWDEPITPLYTAYYIYRSQDGGRTFTQLNKTPLVMTEPDGIKKKGPSRYDDTSVVNYTNYIYRLRGITPFGDLSQPADVESYGRDLTPPPAPLPNKPQQLSSTKLKLTWDMKATSGDLVGFVIARSATSLGGYHQIFEKPLPKDAREYIDDSASASEPYYIIASVDTAGNVAPGLPVYGEMIDTTPPSVPTGLTGTVDTNGIVQLHWHLGPELNIIGYRVLWANAPTHEYSQRTGKPVRDTSFTDTISLLTNTPYIYYRIAAVNNRYNHSAMSDPIAIRRPDKLPPASPVFTDVFVTDSAVQLTWAPSASEDVAAHELYRRIAEQKEWKKIATFGPKDKRYTDTSVKQNVMYQYTLQAVDSSGLHSTQAFPVQARPYDNGSRPPVDEVTATFDSASHTITVSWSYRNIKNEKYFFILYRAVKNSPLTQYKAVDGAQTQFADTDLLGAGLYEYAVKVKTKDGAESRVSAHARVAVK